MPGFSMALVGIPLAAATMALGAVDTGSMKASEMKSATMDWFSQFTQK